VSIKQAEVNSLAAPASLRGACAAIGCKRDACAIWQLIAFAFTFISSHVKRETGIKFYSTGTIITIPALVQSPPVQFRIYHRVAALC